MKRIRPLATLSCVLLVSIVPTACSRPNHFPNGAPLPRRPATLHVSLADFYFVYPNRVPAGRVVFEVTNAGEFTHQLTLFRRSEGAVTLKQQVLTSPQPAEAPLQRMPSLQSGQAGTFAVDLIAGARYAMASLVVGPDGRNDAQKGMTSEFRAGGRTLG